TAPSGLVQEKTLTRVSCSQTRLLSLSITPAQISSTVVSPTVTHSAAPRACGSRCCWAKSSRTVSKRGSKEPCIWVILLVLVRLMGWPGLFRSGSGDAGIRARGGAPTAQLAPATVGAAPRGGYSSTRFPAETAAARQG